MLRASEDCRYGTRVGSRIWGRPRSLAWEYFIIYDLNLQSTDVESQLRTITLVRTDSVIGQFWSLGREVVILSRSSHKSSFLGAIKPDLGENSDYLNLIIFQI